MSLYAAGSLPGLGFVAADARAVFGKVDDADASGPRDGFCKMVATPKGWITGGSLMSVVEFLGDRLADCRSPEQARDMVVANHEAIQQLVIDAPSWYDSEIEHYGEARHGASKLVFAAPGRVTHIDWWNGVLEDQGATALSVTSPGGVSMVEIAELRAAYIQRVAALLRPGGPPPTGTRAILEIVRATAQFFAGVYTYCGPDGPVSAEVEVGIIRRSPQLEHLHYSPTLATIEPTAEALKPTASGAVRYGWITPLTKEPV